jgi:glutamine synthetase
MKITNFQEIQELARENKCEYIDLKFGDLTGGWKHLTLTISKLEMKMFSEGIGFDGSSIRGFQKIYDSDMIIVPDITTAFIDPVPESPTISLICDIKDSVTRENYLRDPRYIARKAESYLKNSGVADVSYWGPELEFFIFNSVRFDTNGHESYFHINTREGMWNSGDNADDNTGYFIRQKEGYFGIPPNDQLLNLRSTIVKAMIEAGLDIDFHHHEVATAGQTEIGMHYDTLVRQADNVLLGKYIAKNITQQNGYRHFYA